MMCTSLLRPLLLVLIWPWALKAKRLLLKGWHLKGELMLYKRGWLMHVPPSDNPRAMLSASLVRAALFARQSSPKVAAPLALSLSRSLHLSPFLRHGEYQAPPDGASSMKGEEMLRTSLQFSLEHKPGSLSACLEEFSSRGINLVQLKSREGRDTDKGRGMTMYVDLDGHVDQAHVQEAIESLRKKSLFLTVVGSYRTPYFPLRIEDLDNLDQTTLSAGAELDAEHPGFHDKEYRKRREMIVENASTFRYGQQIPRVDYTSTEVETWGHVYNRLQTLFSSHTCREYQYIFPLLVENCGYSPNNIPQLQDISDFLREQTGFTLRPVAGLLSARDFLACLAFRVFSSTQYIRHHSNPEYTPEPDVCHELLGHVPLYADPDFADFSQAIGLASLGASDEDIEKLATCYWFSVEFGLCRQGGEVRAYGAGLLSSFGELEYCVTDKPELKPWDPFVACNQKYPITKFQPTYFVAENFKSAKDKLEEFAASLNRPFKIAYNPYAQSVKTISINTERYMRNMDWE